ncbi:TPA: restriction endonuclease subunit S [Streptococcus suis]
MPNKDRNIPKRRFKAFENADAWELRKLGEVATRVTRKNSDLLTELALTISAQYGLIDQTEFFDKRIASKDVSGYYLVKNGEFAYNKSTSSDAPWGAVKRLDRYDMGVLSTLYIVFGISNFERVCSDFLVTYFDTNLWHKEVQAVAAEGARNHGLLNISASDFLDIALYFPKSLPEQKAIGTFFSTLDQQITLHQRKLDKLKNVKQAYLSEMFPAEGERVPKRRFPGFTDDWELRKLGEVANFSKGNGYSKKDLVEEGSPIILYGRLYTRYETVISEIDTFVLDEENRSNTVFSEGGEVLVPASGESALDIARASVVSEKGIVLGGDLNIIRLISEISPIFLALTISNGKTQKELSKRAQGKSVVHLHNSDLKEVEFMVPSLPEQKAIGTFFSTLDQQITLHQRKLEKLKNLKKALLNELFV